MNRKLLVKFGDFEGFIGESEYNQMEKFFKEREEKLPQYGREFMQYIGDKEHEEEKKT